MIPGVIQGAFLKYVTPIAFAAGLISGGAVTWLLKSAQVASGKVALAECQSEIVKLQAGATQSALDERIKADEILAAERERIAYDISRGQAAVANEAAKLRKQLSELSLQPDYACLDRPLPSDVLERLRRPAAAHGSDPSVRPSP
jgi:hypothetical protein